MFVLLQSTKCIRRNRIILSIFTTLLLLVLPTQVAPTESMKDLPSHRRSRSLQSNNDNLKAMETFETFDKDQNGYIDRSEYSSLYSNLLINYPKLGDSTNEGISPSVFQWIGISNRTPSSSSKNSETSKTITKKDVDDLKFWPAFVNSLSMIIATEIGDKTFFIAAVLSMKNDRFAVFSGAILALIVMTILSSLMGLVLPSFLPRKYTHIIGGLLFLYFGIKLILDSRSMSKGKCSDELEEVEEELLQQSSKKEDLEIEDSMETGAASPSKAKQSSSISRHTKSQIFIQAFSMTFIAEWGDRSQIATIALAAAKNPLGVNVGGILGHSLCTGVAVMGGRMLAAKIEEKTVTKWSGIIFLGFGIHSLFFEES